MLQFFKRIFSGRKKKAASARSPEMIERRLDELLVEARGKLMRFLATRRVASGLVKKTAGWSLMKTGFGLFRLDGTNFSVVINTEPFLARRDNKITGLLRMSETALCNALHESKGLEGFVKRAEPLAAHSRQLLEELTGAHMPADEETFDARPGLEDLDSWSAFDVDQMIARNSANTLAHALIHAGEKTEALLKKRLSSRMKSTLISELESLLSSGSRPELNPHSRARSLTQFDQALADFQESMRQYHMHEAARAARQRRSG